MRVFFPQEKIDKLRFLRDQKRLTRIAFLLFLIPGTPKDIMTYCVGLTNMKLSTWMVICTLARIPSILTSTLGGDALGTKKPMGRGGHLHRYRAAQSRRPMAIQPDKPNQRSKGRFFLIAFLAGPTPPANGPPEGPVSPAAGIRRAGAKPPPFGCPIADSNCFCVSSHFLTASR